jgi:hypothetical protein
MMWKNWCIPIPLPTKSQGTYYYLARHSCSPPSRAAAGRWGSHEREKQREKETKRDEEGHACVLQEEAEEGIEMSLSTK